jgi:hypothetical protein
VPLFHADAHLVVEPKQRHEHVALTSPSGSARSVMESAKNRGVW